MIEPLPQWLADIIRQPEPDETPLSIEEIWVAIRNGWRPLPTLREQHQTERVKNGRNTAGAR